MSIPLDAQMQALAAQAATAVASTGLRAIAAWTEYVEAVRATANPIRALEAADLIYLDGCTLRDVAAATGSDDRPPLAYQAVADWLRRFGPTEYATVRQVGDRHEIIWVDVVGSTTANRKYLASLIAAGRRVAPATWRLTRETVPSAKALWDRIGPQRTA